MTAEKHSKSPFSPGAKRSGAQFGSQSTPVTLRIAFLTRHPAFLDNEQFTIDTHRIDVPPASGTLQHRVLANTGHAIAPCLTEFLNLRLPQCTQSAVVEPRGHWLAWFLSMLLLTCLCWVLPLVHPTCRLGLPCRMRAVCVRWCGGLGSTISLVLHGCSSRDHSPWILMRYVASGSADRNVSITYRSGSHVRPLIRQRHRDNIQVVVAEDLVRSHRMQLATSLPILAIRDEMPQFTVVSVHSVATVTPVIFYSCN